MIAIDFETRLISEEETIPTPICLSYYRSDTDQGVIKGIPEMKLFIRQLLVYNEAIIAHNMCFEALVIWKHFPDLRELLEERLQEDQLICTKVNEQLLDSQRKQQLHSFSLDKLVSHYFHTDISESKKDPNSWRLRYSELENVPLSAWPPEAVKYAQEDAQWAFKCYSEQLKTSVNAQLSVKADFYLNLMAQGGMLVDKTRVLYLERELWEQIMPFYLELEKIGIVEKLSANKYKKNMNNFRHYIEQNIQNPEFTAKGTISTSSESINLYLSTLEEGEVKDMLNSYLNIMKSEKYLTAFISRLKTANPLIRTKYKPVVSSGRTSSSTDRNYSSINIQQIPRTVPNVKYDLRNCFKPRPGFLICSIDYAGLELASTAHQLSVLTDRSDMKKIVNSGFEPVDMHSMLAYRIMNLKEGSKETYESFVAQKKASKYAAYRQLAKPINLGFPGGIGYDTMRTLLAKEGIYPKLVVLETAKYEEHLLHKRTLGRKQGYPVRIRRMGKFEFQLVYDELVALKSELFALYPDLEHFLTEGHLEFTTGQTKMVKNKFNEWEKEPMYSYEVAGFKRDWCMYTQVCNGLLMQSPAAVGAKKAMCSIISRYINHPDVNPLAFIHDEIVLEVRECEAMYRHIEDISRTMINEMQSVLNTVRITVEAELFPYWAKSGGIWSETYWKDPTWAELKRAGG